ncbi:MAG: tetracycline repressor protein class [Acidimicrobiales bacterium]|nr:tetracycline repressor protein class [Acidimicrobiales bacterium]
MSDSSRSGADIEGSGSPSRATTKAPKTPQANRTAPRAAGPLSRDRILATALKLVDEHGFPALTMRRLAAELSVEPMSIYHHVPNKRALVDGVVGRVVAEVKPLHDLQGPWRVRIREACRRLRQVLVDHPRVAAAVATRPIMDVATVALTEDALAQLTSWGLSLEEANEILWLCNALVMGTTVTRAEWTANQTGAAALQDLWAGDAGLDVEAYPLALASYGRSAINPEQGDQRFERALDIFVVGIADRYRHIHDPEE